jgi:hypothetical protein
MTENRERKKYFFLFFFFLLPDLFFIVFRPKEGNHTFLEDYRKAEEIGKSNQVKKIEIDKQIINLINIKP